MRTIDFSPLYRSVVGFDRLADLLDSAAVDSASGYPPYNIERTDENAYRVEIAVAGFRAEELSIEVKENLLTVTGRKAANDEPRRFLHRGLAEPLKVAQIDLVFCSGPLMHTLWQALPSNRRGGYAEASAELEPAVLAAIRDGDAVMVKGSLGSKMGPIVKALERQFARPAAQDQAAAQGA